MTGDSGDIGAAHDAAGGVAMPENAPRTETATRDRRIGVHHSALERNVRHRTEAELRSGALRVVVCSSSLELGVDIGFVDRVVVLGGARGMTPTLQRVGRAGHRPGAVAHGRRARAGPRRHHRSGRDAALHPRRRHRRDRRARRAARRARAVARRPVRARSPHRDRRRARDRAARVPVPRPARGRPARVRRYLAGGGAGGEEAHVRRIGTDGDAVYGLGREASSAYFENVGTIPDESTMPVAGTGGRGIGRLDEGFAASMNVGDVFLLEGRSAAREGGRPARPARRAARGPPDRSAVELAPQGHPERARRRDRRAAHGRRRRRCAPAVRKPRSGTCARGMRSRGSRRRTSRATSRSRSRSATCPMRRTRRRDLPHGRTADRRVPHRRGPPHQRDARARRRRASAPSCCASARR